MKPAIIIAAVACLLAFDAIRAAVAWIGRAAYRAGCTTLWRDLERLTAVMKETARFSTTTATPGQEPHA